MLPLLSLLLACDPDPVEVDHQPPGELVVGVARVRMPIPVGIGTAGFGGFGVDAEPSPFAEIYPATTRVHIHPSFEAAVVSRGPGHELVFLRTDTVAIFQQLRRAVVLELHSRLGRDLDDALIMGATHTHSGPGRLIDMGGPFDLITDRFLPQHYLRLVDAMADVVELAFADARPGRVGLGWAYTDEGHNDRRCEDGLDYTNGSIPLVALEQQGEVRALVMSYAVHGTVVSIDDLTLTADSMGGIEQLVADGFDHPVEVLSFNSWGADMSPAHPTTPIHDPFSDQPSGYDHIEAVGYSVSAAVHEALPELTWHEEPVVRGQTTRWRIDRELMGYEQGTFPYEYGGTFCGGDAGDCDPETVEEDFDQVCLAFTEDYPAPTQTVITLAQVGPRLMVTWPGEPGTLLGEASVDAVSAVTGSEDVAFFGYAQDYNGYALLEDDWWQGGYEASGGLWGPRQGEYILDLIGVAANHFASPSIAGLEQPAPIEPFDVTDVPEWELMAAIDPGTLLVDVEPSYGLDEVVVFAVRGSDPWLGAPVATLQTASGEPVLRSSGAPITSDDLAFWVDLEPVPGYREEATERSFDWRFSLPVTHEVPSGLPELSGTYRLVVSVPLADGTAAEVISSDFEVSP